MPETASAGTAAIMLIIGTVVIFSMLAFGVWLATRSPK